MNAQTKYRKYNRELYHSYDKNGKQNGYPVLLIDVKKQIENRIAFIEVGTEDLFVALEGRLFIFKYNSEFSFASFDQDLVYIHEIQKTYLRIWHKQKAICVPLVEKYWFN